MLGGLSISNILATTQGLDNTLCMVKAGVIALKINVCKVKHWKRKHIVVLYFKEEAT